MTTNLFYGRSLDDRIEALTVDTLREHYDRGIHILLDEIADGCGGCERAMFSAPSGNDGWVSVLGSESRRTWFAYIEFSRPLSQIMFATYGSMPWNPENGPEDSPKRYAQFVKMIWEWMEAD